MSTFTPFALELYRRHLAGDTAEKLASELEIPLDRVEKRLQAAGAYVARHNRELANASGAAHAAEERAAQPMSVFLRAYCENAARPLESA